MILRKRNKATFSLLFFLLTTITLTADDAALSLAYLGQAQEALDSGNWNTADILIDAAGEFSNDYSDFWYYKAVIQEKRETVSSALESLSQARELDDWRIVTLLDGMLLYSKLLIRTGRYKEQIALYNETPPIYRTDRELLFLTLSSAYRDGLFDLARTVAETGEDYYPDDTRFSLYLYLLNPVELRFNTFLRKQNINPVSKQLQQYFLMQWDESGDLDRLEAAFDSDNWFRLYFNDESLSAEDIFSASVGDFSLLDEHAEQDWTQYLLEIDYNGSLYGDRNADGFFEESISYEDGVLSEYRLDINQDGILELVIYYTDGSIRGAEIENLSITYSEYPQVEWAEVQTDTVLKRYFYDFHDLSIPLVAEDEYTLSQLAIHKPMEVSITEEYLLENSVKITYSLDDRCVMQYQRDEDGVAEITEDFDCNGITDHRLYLKDNRIVYGRRDMDEDSFYETYEHYENGRWIGLSVDSDQDGIPEYYEDWEYILKMLWDDNGDGNIDNVFLADVFDRDQIFRSGLLFPEILELKDLNNWELQYEKHTFK